MTAAGNTGQDNDEVARFPCDFRLPNEICVTASDNKDQLPPWANYGVHTVDLAAPGVSIYSTLAHDRYGYISGGSMASPQVAGAAALILSVEPSLSAEELKADLLDHVDKVPSLSGQVITGGRLDVCKAIPGCPLPSVETNLASAPTQTSAVLNATVNPNGSEVSGCRFDYGSSESYGSSVPCGVLPGSGSVPVGVSALLAGLSPATSYHFRIVASNVGGTSYGADSTFETLPNPPAVETTSASSLTQTSAILHATVNPASGTVNDCHFDYGTSISYGASAPCSSPPASGSGPVAESAALNDLSPSTSYHFRIVASNAGGTAFGADQVFTTPPAPAPAPVQPGGQGAPPSQGVLPSQERKAPAVPDAQLAGRSLFASRSGTVSVKLSCPSEESSCTGTVTLRTFSAVSVSAMDQLKKRKAVLTLAVGSFTLAGGKTITLKLHLSSKARAVLARAQVLLARATILAHDPAGATHTTRTTVTLRAPKVMHGPRPG